MEYKYKLYEAMRRKIKYEDNTFKSYVLLWERCTKAMQKIFHQDWTTIAQYIIIRLNCS